MKCIIIDDEPLAREGMKLNINEVSNLELVGDFENALQANEFLQNNDVDLMFLDIQMPGMTGIEFLKSLPYHPLVILTTAYPQYALESYELDVIDYLVKPIRIERFIKAVNKAREYCKLKKEPGYQLENIDDNYFYVKADRKYVKLHFNDITHIEGLKDYVIIHTENDKIMTAMNVKTINGYLPNNLFVRINKSFIININHIKEIDNDFVILGKHEIPIGRTYKENFINNYVSTRLIKR